MEQNYKQRSQPASTKRTQVRNTSDYFEEEEYDDYLPSRMPRSAIRYRVDMRTEPGFQTEDDEYIESSPNDEYTPYVSRARTSTGRSTNAAGAARSTTGRHTSSIRRTTSDDDIMARQTTGGRRSSNQTTGRNTTTGRQTRAVPAVRANSPTSGRVQAAPVRRTGPYASTSSSPARASRRSTSISTDDIQTGPGYSTNMNLPVPQDRPHYRQQHRVRFHWLVYVGLAMLFVTLGWLALTSLLRWCSVTLDDWRYGRPRTFQTDAYVGHSDSKTNPSHFIVVNLQRRVEIIEIPGGDASKAKIYTGPVLMGQDQDLAPVTLTFEDVNGDGKTDMIVNVQNSRFAYINDKGGFRPARDNEHGQLN